MVTEGDFTMGGENMTQSTDDIFQNCTPELYDLLMSHPNIVNIYK